VSCEHDYGDEGMRCKRCGARIPEDHPRAVNRARKIAYAAANDFAVIRESAKNWGSSQVGRHMRAALAAIDGVAPLSAECRQEIRERGYHSGCHGDSMGDYMTELLAELHRREHA